MKYFILIFWIILNMGCSISENITSSDGTSFEHSRTESKLSQDNELVKCMGELKKRLEASSLAHDKSRVNELFYLGHKSGGLGYPKQLKNQLSRGIEEVSFATIDSLGLVPIPNLRDDVEATYYFNIKFKGENFPKNLLVWAGHFSNNCYFLETNNFFL